MSEFRLKSAMGAAWSGIRAHKGRTFTASLAMAWGTVTLVAILAVIKGFEKESLDRARELGGLRGGRTKVAFEETKVDFSVLLSWVDRGTSMDELAALIANFHEDGVLLRGITDFYLDFLKYDLDQGRLLCPGDQLARTRMCVIGSDVAARLGSDAVGSYIDVAGQRFRVVGTLTSRGEVFGFHRWKDTVAHIPFTTALECFPDKIHGMEFFHTLDDEGRPLCTPPFNLEEGCWNSNWAQHVKSKVAADKQKRGAWVLISMSVFMACLGVVTIFSTGVRERITEIGVRRAVGATSSHIMIQFITETTICGLFGSAMGYVLGELAVRILTRTVELPRAVTPTVILLCFLVGPVCGMIAGLIPALTARKIDPIKAIRIGE